MAKYFGTDGIRGKAGGLITPSFIKRTANAIALYCGRLTEKPYAVMGHDTRDSCTWIIEIFEKVFSQHGIRLHNAGCVPTAALAYLTMHCNAQVGIMITASHNGPKYNGIKLFNPRGEKLGASDIGIIENLIDAWENFLINTFRHKSKDPKPRIALDCANGSGTQTAKQVFSALGIQAKFYNTEDDGRNINKNCGALFPQNLAKIISDDGGFDMGFCFDGDADRLVVLDGGGRVIHGDVLLALLAVHGHHPPSKHKLATTILFNGGAEQYLRDHSINVIRTDVGDRHVMAAMTEHGLTLGGETSGHIIFADIFGTGDGLVTALMTIQMVAVSGRTIADLANDVTLYPSVSHNTIADKKKKAALDTDEWQQFLALVQTNHPDFRIIVRPSGTEDLIRLTVEGPDTNVCKKIIKILAERLT